MKTCRKGEMVTSDVQRDVIKKFLMFFVVAEEVLIINTTFFSFSQSVSVCDLSQSYQRRGAKKEGC